MLVGRLGTLWGELKVLLATMVSASSTVGGPSVSKITGIGILLMVRH